MLEAMQRGIECALVHAQDIIGELTNPVGDGETVHGAEREHFEYQKIECALQKFI